ncbi:hypothetical protein [Bradyrhizobium elkanii]|uniref:hypothetical protein n=1 Tax=Bradyrhizobium elkanii TaxID=29448 RepID=UPI00056E24D4|nr:hypothetical protein [Bradyrhizobium elkanii]
MIDRLTEIVTMDGSTPTDREIDFFDPAVVQDLICQASPFGDLLRYEGIEEACRRGLGRKLVEICTPTNIPEQDEVALAEMIDPPVEWVMSIGNLEHRAYVILATGFYGTDECHRQAILSVEDAGVVGLLAQANLRPPEKIKRRRPASRRYSGRSAAPRGDARQRQSGRGNVGIGDLFEAFER